MVMGRQSAICLEPDAFGYETADVVDEHREEWAQVQSKLIVALLHRPHTFSTLPRVLLMLDSLHARNIHMLS